MVERRLAILFATVGLGVAAGCGIELAGLGGDAASGGDAGLDATVRTPPRDAGADGAPGVDPFDAEADADAGELGADGAVLDADAGDAADATDADATDAADAADAPPSDAPSATVPCGAATCSRATSVCCVDAGLACVASGSCNGLSLACNDRTDCSGQSCCFERGPERARCKTSCGGSDLVVCDPGLTPSSCADAAPCRVPDGGVAGYGVCP